MLDAQSVGAQSVYNHMKIHTMHIFLHTLKRAVLPRDCRTNGPSDQWFIRPIEPMGTSDQQAAGPMGSRTTEPSDQRVYKIGPSDKRAVGSMGHQTNGSSDQWASNQRVVGSTGHRTETYLFNVYINDLIVKLKK